MDVEDFAHEVQPHHKRSKLLKFKGQIGTLKRQGYSDMQICQWLTQNSCQVSRENVRRFIKRHLPELNVVPLPQPLNELVTGLGGDSASSPMATTTHELDGGSGRESVAERILRQTREQRDEAAHHMFQHDKTGNNH